MDMLTQMGAQLGVDITLVWIFITVSLLYIALRVVYLTPFLNLLKLRKQRTVGTKKEAHELLEKADKRFEEYKSKLRMINLQAKDILATSETECKKQEATILAQANTQAKKLIQDAQATIETEKQKAVSSLSTELSNLSAEIAERVLGRSVKP